MIFGGRLSPTLRSFGFSLARPFCLLTTCVAKGANSIVALWTRWKGYSLGHASLLRLSFCPPTLFSKNSLKVKDYQSKPEIAVNAVANHRCSQYRMLKKLLFQDYWFFNFSIVRTKSNSIRITLQLCYIMSVELVRVLLSYVPHLS